MSILTLSLLALSTTVPTIVEARGGHGGGHGGSRGGGSRGGVALVQVEALSQVVRRVEVRRAEEVLSLVAQNLMVVLPKLEALTVVNQLVVVQVPQVQLLNHILSQKQTQNLTKERA